MQAPDETLTLATADTDGRAKFWLDDLVACVTAPLSLLDEDAVNRREISKVIQLGLEFAFLKTIVLGGVTYTAWKPLRKELRSLDIKAHGTALMLSNASSGLPAGAGVDAVTDRVLALLQEPDNTSTNPDPVSAGVPACAEVSLIRQFAEDQATIKSLIAFMTRNHRAHAGQVTPTTCQPAASDLTHRMIGKISCLRMHTRKTDADRLAAIVLATAEDLTVSLCSHCNPET